jgi:hypothetical protein
MSEFDSLDQAINSRECSSVGLNAEEFSNAF